ncbi:MAG: diguanylate cyclase [Gammaproteobacteria bacterium]|nr:diguanylate cyclase [Gammaproteobacteria bacterium]
MKIPSVVPTPTPYKLKVQPDFNSLDMVHHIVYIDFLMIVFGKQMKIINQKMFFVVSLIAFLSVTFALYQQQEETTRNEAEKRMDIFMKKWKALFDYVETEQKEAIYTLQEKGVLDKDYFDPHVLSFTYIARQVQLRYEEMELENNITPYYYRLAATNPRNIANKATEHEAIILNKFRAGELSRYTEIKERDGKRFFLNYTPIDRTDKSCMKCHSDPAKAPKDLVDMYGAVAGFGDKIGGIRAMVIMEIPIDEIEKEALNNFASTSAVILFIFIGAYIFIGVLMRKEHELQKINTVLEERSNTDGLTGISNRRQFDRHLEQQWRAMKRNKGSISLIFCDIDDFKIYNDTYGHIAGDECLCAIASAITKKASRPSDLTARYGGEEFAVILPDTKLKAAARIAESIRQAIVDLNIPHEKSETSSCVTISIGVATMKLAKDVDSYDKLIQNADRLLYSAKRMGKNQVASDQH